MNDNVHDNRHHPHGDLDAFLKTVRSNDASIDIYRRSKTFDIAQIRFEQESIQDTIPDLLYALFDMPEAPPTLIGSSKGCLKDGEIKIEPDEDRQFLHHVLYKKVVSYDNPEKFSFDPSNYESHGLTNMLITHNVGYVIGEAFRFMSLYEPHNKTTAMQTYLINRTLRELLCEIRTLTLLSRMDTDCFMAELPEPTTSPDNLNPNVIFKTFNADKFRHVTTFLKDHGDTYLTYFADIQKTAYDD